LRIRYDPSVRSVEGTSARRARISAAACLAAVLSACAATPRSVEELTPRNAPGVDLRGELAIEGRVVAIGATPSGRVLLATMTGSLYGAPQLGRDWSEVVDPGNPRGEAMWPTNRVLRGLVQGLAFANDSQAMAWGSIPTTERSGDSVAVFTTADGGLTWTARPVGRGSQLAATDLRPSGVYWAAGYLRGTRLQDALTTVVYRSADFGTTWEVMPAPVAASPPSDIAMDDDGTGLLAMLRNSLFVTSDSGRTWNDIPTPFDQQAYHKSRNDPDWPRITSAKLARGQMLVIQDGQAFTSALDRVAWRPITDDAVRFVTLDRATRDWCVLDDAWRLRIGRSPSQLSPPLRPGLAAPAIAAECRDATMHAVDLEGRVYALTRGETVAEFPLTSTSARNPIVREQQRGSAHWGATMRQLYGTANDGHTWYRYPFAVSGIAGFAARSAHEVFVWDGHGANSIFDRRTGQSREVPTLAGRDVVQVIDQDSIWIAFGGRQGDAARRVEVAQTFFAGQFRGSASFGFVMISRDSGETWTEIDRWAESGVAALSVSEGARHLVAVSYLGAVRAIGREGAGFSGTTLLTATAENRRTVPYVQVPTALHFVSADTGFIAGDIHHVGRKTFKTVDGGRNWTPVAQTEFPFDGLVRTTSGMVGWDRSRVYRLRGAVPELVATIVQDSSRQYIQYAATLPRNELLLSTWSFRERQSRRVRVDLRSGQWRDVQ
jgi:hypothetical protein